MGNAHIIKKSVFSMKKKNKSLSDNDGLAPRSVNKGLSPNKKRLTTASAKDPYFKKRKNPRAKI